MVVRVRRGVLVPLKPLACLHHRRCLYESRLFTIGATAAAAAAFVELRRRSRGYCCFVERVAAP